MSLYRNIQGDFNTKLHTFVIVVTIIKYVKIKYVFNPLTFSENWI